MGRQEWRLPVPRCSVDGRGDQRASGHLPGTYRILAAVSETVLPMLLAAAGLVATGMGAALIRSSGADTRTGRRLAGAPAAAIPDLQDLAARNQLPPGPVRIAGRVRCVNPLVLPTGDRLAALHRDVEVALPDGEWRVIERIREARGIDLWERTASVQLDLAGLAEPLITIPQVWEGSPMELGDDYRAALERLATHGLSARRARATTRRISLVDQLIVLAVPERNASGRLRLTPPPGGFLVANVELDTAMRLLAGPRRARMLAGFAISVVGAAAVVGGAIALALALAG